MRTHITLAAALAACATGAYAGGIDRSGQSVAVIFEEGDYVEATLSYAKPKVSGAAGAAASGDMAGDYMQFGFAYKTDLNDKFSLAVIADEPFGADVSYPTGTAYPLAGTSAEVNSFGLTVIGNYQATERFSVHGGLRYITADGFYDPTAPMPPPIPATVILVSSSVPPMKSPKSRSVRRSPTPPKSSSRWTGRRAT